MRNLVNNIVEWGNAKDLHKAGAIKQGGKTLEEYAELLDAYAIGDKEEAIDAIGDILVTLIVGASNEPEVLEHFTEFLVEGGFDIKFIDSARTLHRPLSDMLVSIIDIKEFGVMTEYEAITSDLSEVLNILNYKMGLDKTLQECLDISYNVIKNRKGKTVNGVFIKDE